MGGGRSGQIHPALWEMPGDGGDQGVQENQQPAAARVDHPGLGQDGELVRRALQGVRGGLACGSQRLRQLGGLVRREFDGLGGGLQHRHHGAGHHVSPHRRHHQAHAVPQRRAEHRGVDLRRAIGVPSGLLRHFGDRPQDLRQDQPGVAARAVQGPARQGCGDRRDLVGGVLRLGKSRTHGE